jgi:hypothetical protein
LCLEKAGLTQQLLSGKRLVKVRGMKFVYVDESGDQGQSDIFVMAGLLIDAYRLRKWTAAFDEMIKAFLKMHPKAPQELKTKAFINGANKWSEADADDRKQFLEDVCDLAAECARIFAVAFSFDDFKKAVVAGYKQPFGKSYWLGAAMFVSALVQKRMQDEKRNKGLTVLICDDNKQEMANLSEGLYQADAWFDPIYQTSKKKKGKLSGMKFRTTGGSITSSIPPLPSSPCTRR